MDEVTKDYTVIGGISATIAFEIALNILFPNSPHISLAAREFKSASRFYEAVSKTVKPVYETFELLRESQNAEVSGKIEAAIDRLQESTDSDLSQEEREIELETALAQSEWIYAALDHATHLIRKKAEAAKFIATCYLGLNKIDKAQLWFYNAREDYRTLMRRLPDEFGFFETISENSKWARHGSGRYIGRYPYQSEGIPGFNASFLVTLATGLVFPPAFLFVGVATFGSFGATTVAAIATKKNRVSKQKANELLYKEQQAVKADIDQLNEVLAQFP